MLAFARAYRQARDGDGEEGADELGAVVGSGGDLQQAPVVETQDQAEDLAAQPTHLMAPQLAQGSAGVRTGNGLICTFTKPRRTISTSWHQVARHLDAGQRMSVVYSTGAHLVLHLKLTIPRGSGSSWPWPRSGAREIRTARTTNPLMAPAPLTSAAPGTTFRPAGSPPAGTSEGSRGPAAQMLCISRPWTVTA